jgi:hypothetical protein
MQGFRLWWLRHARARVDLQVVLMRCFCAAVHVTGLPHDPSCVLLVGACVVNM